MDPTFIAAAVGIMGGSGILYLNRRTKEVDALEAAPAPAHIKWKKSPYFYGGDNPLKCGSLYE